MHLLADECCPGPIIAALRVQGHDVVSARERMPSAIDGRIALLADQEGRLIVTEDYDFGELAVRNGVRMPGLLILNLAGSSNEERIGRVAEVLERYGHNLFGHMTIVYRDGERIRPLTSQSFP